MPTTAPLSLSTEDALVTASYLDNITSRSESLGVAIQSLFGRCCISTLPGCSNVASLLGKEARDLSRRILEHPRPETLNLDPLLLIETFSILTNQSPNDDLRHILVNIAAGLMGQPAETLQFGRVRRIATRLRDEGFDVPDFQPTKAMASLLASPEKWFGVSAGELAEIADHIAAGQERLDDFSSKVMSLLALAELRNYRVDLGCSLLRIVLENGEACPESVEAVNFIALQRRRDGRYGFPNQFAEAAEPSADPHLTVHLPLTVNAVWLFRVAARSHDRIHFVAGAK